MNSMNNSCIVTPHISSFNLRCEIKFNAFVVVGFSFCECHFNVSAILNVLDNLDFRNAMNNSSLTNNYIRLTSQK